MKRGFTLVEILVVIAVIAVVASLRFPALAAAKRSSYGTVEISQMRQVSIAETMYEGDHNSPPDSLSDTLQYSGSSKIFQSPLDPRISKPPEGWTATPFVSCSKRYSPFLISYGFIPQWAPYDEFWTEVRDEPSVGMILSPWTGQAVGHQLRGDFSCEYGPENAFASGAVQMDGAIYRISMDGSFYRLHARTDGPFVTSDDLFFPGPIIVPTIWLF